MSNNTTSPPVVEVDHTTLPAHIASVWVWRICSPLLIIVGTVGNALSIIVLTRRSMRATTMSIYLIVLSVVDILVLYTGLLRQYIRVEAEMDVRELSELSCKIHIWLVYSSLDVSVWILVAVTLERVVSVWAPHRVKEISTPLKTCVVIVTVVVVLLILNSHFLYGLGDVKESQDGEEVTVHCTYLWDEYNNFNGKVWPWIDLCAFSLIPLTVLTVANVSIIHKVVASRRATRRVNPLATMVGTQRTSSRTSSMTMMLHVLNLVFFVCTVPISIYLIREPYYLEETPEQAANTDLAWAVVNILMYTNNSINFLLYCISGSRFRETLKTMFTSRTAIFRSSFRQTSLPVIANAGDSKPKTNIQISSAKEKQVPSGNLSVRKKY